MITNESLESSNTLPSQAAVSADRAFPSTPRVADDARFALSGSAQDVHGQDAPTPNRTRDQLGALAQRGVDAVRDGSQQLRDKALRASDSAVGYVKDEPVKSMLIAAATGAALMALLGLVFRSRRP